MLLAVSWFQRLSCRIGDRSVPNLPEYDVEQGVEAADRGSTKSPLGGRAIGRDGGQPFFVDTSRARNKSRDNVGSILGTPRAPLAYIDIAGEGRI